MSAIYRAVAFVALCLPGVNLHAATLSISTDAPVQPGAGFVALVTIETEVVDFEAWDLTLYFDDGVMDFVDGAYGDGISNSGGALLGPVSNSPAAGVAKISGAVLSAIQPPVGSVLFELTFTMHADASPGISLLDADLIANEVSLIEGSGEIEIAVIPIPAAAWLMCSALLGLFGLGRRFSSNLQIKNN